MSDTTEIVRLMRHAADLCDTARTAENERHAGSGTNPFRKTLAALATAEVTLRMVAACVTDAAPDPTGSQP